MLIPLFDNDLILLLILDGAGSGTIRVAGVAHHLGSHFSVMPWIKHPLLRLCFPHLYFILSLDTRCRFLFQLVIIDWTSGGVIFNRSDNIVNLFSAKPNVLNILTLFRTEALLNINILRRRIRILRRNIHRN